MAGKTIILPISSANIIVFRYATGSTGILTKVDCLCSIAAMTFAWKHHYYRHPLLDKKSMIDVDLRSLDSKEAYKYMNIHRKRIL